MKKRELGQFFTPQAIADFMAELVLTDGTQRLLDPSVGMGVLTKAAYDRKRSLMIEACEIDSDMAEQFRQTNDYPYRLHEGDYLTTDFAEPFDAIICNPPYNKFQAIPRRKQFMADFKKKYHIAMSGYSNLCVFFLMKSMNELKANGRCCYIMPYEFLNTGYGTVIKQYLLDSGMLRTIYRFHPNLHLFDEAVTTSCIIVLENSQGSAVDFVRIDSMEELYSGVFRNVRTCAYTGLNPAEKWLSCFEEDKRPDYVHLVKMSVFGRLSRGIATGANNFFVLNRTAVEQRQLSAEVCVPCLTKASDVKDIVLTEQSFAQMAAADKKVYLFDGTKAVSDHDFAYLEYGVSLGADQAYLTRHRHPWYRPEDKPPAPILIGVFSRDGLKIIRNEAGVRHLTAFHGLYLNDAEENFADILFCYLLTPLAQELLLRSKREYGDGLTKFEPNDLTHAEMLDLRLIRPADRQKILRMYAQIKEVNQVILTEELDAVFRPYTKRPVHQN